MRELMLILTLYGEFKEDAKTFGIELPKDSIVFLVDNLYDDNQALGKIEWKGTYWLCTIDSLEAKIAPRGSLKNTVYHELGHALLGRGDTFVYSIMNPEYSHKDLYKKRNKELIRELFIPGSYHERF